MIFDYYAYWNGGQIRDLFEALVAICSGPSYLGLLKSAILAGFLVTLTGALLRWQGLAAKVYLFAALLFYSVMLIPKCEIAIHDERSADAYVVSNVPMGVGFFASVTSKIGHFLTQSFEGAFSLPDAERFSRFGLVYPQRAITALLSAGPVTPEGRSMTERIVADCIGPELMDHPNKMNELAESGSLWQTISQSGWLNPARSTLKPNGEVQSCEEALVTLDDHLNDTELSFLKKRLGVILAPERVDPSDVIARTLPHSEALLLGLSRSLEESLKHSLMLTSIPSGLASVAAQAGAPLDLAVKFSSSSANLSSEINYRTLAKLAEQSLPKIRNCVEFIVIAAFPLMLVLMVGAGPAAGTIFRSFFVLLIWFQLWAPLFSVANYLMITVDANPMNRLTAEFGGSTLLAADLIREAGASSQAIAGSLMLLIPVIAFALAKGSDMAFVSMATGLMAPAQNAAGSAASQISAGNASAGNVSTGNISSNNSHGNKSDLSSSWSDPYASKTQTAYGSVTRDGDGVVTGMQKTGIDLGVSASGALSQTRSAGLTSSQSATLTSTESAGLSIASSATSSDTALRSFAQSLSEGVANKMALSSGTSAGQSAGLTENTGSASAVSRSLSNSESLGITSGLQLKAALGAAVSEGSATPTQAAGSAIPAEAMPSTTVLSAVGQNPQGTASNNGKGSFAAKLRGAAEGLGTGISGEVKTAQQLIDTAISSETAASMRQRAESYQTLRNTSEEIAAGATDENIRQAARSFTAALDKAYRATTDKMRSSSEVRSSSNSVSESLSGTDNVAVNRDTEVMNQFLSSNGTSPEQGLRDLFHNRTGKDQLGAKVAADAHTRTESGEYIGKGQIPESPLNTDRVRRDARSKVTEEEVISHSKVKSEGTLIQTAHQKEVHNEFSREEVRAQFLKQYDKERSLQEELTSAKADTVDLKQEAVKDSSARYQREEKGLSVVARNAFLGGVGYQKPLSDKEPH